MKIKESYAYERCAEDTNEWTVDDEVYMAGKRNSVEMESGDEEPSSKARVITGGEKRVD